MVENGVQRTNTLLIHYILLGVTAILAGIVHQLSSWGDLPWVDPGLLPFAVMLLGGLLISSISSLLEGAVAGMYAGFLVAISGILYSLLAGTGGVTSVRTAFSYCAIMTCLGPLFGVIGAVPGTLLRRWQERRPAKHAEPGVAPEPKIPAHG